MAINGFTAGGLDLDNSLVRREFFQEGNLWAWGEGFYGGMGDNTVISKSSPVQTVAGGANWKSLFLAANGTSIIASKSDGSLWSWGNQTTFFAQLGINSDTPRSSPTLITVGGSNWRNAAIGTLNGAAIDSVGGLWTWGRGNRQNLGDGTAAHRATPGWIGGANTWVQVSIGDGHSAAIDNSGRLWTWGKNYYGELGQGDALHRDVPTQVGVNTSWRSVSCGYGQNVTAIKTDGTLWVWGPNSNGYALPIASGARSSPVQSLAAGTNWVQSVIAPQGGCAIKSDGTLWTWGSGRRGMLGDNTIIAKSSPIQTVAGGTNWKQCSGGGYNCAAIKTDGTLWIWGDNSAGQLGINDITHRSSPIQTITGGTNWKEVASRSGYTYAITYVDP